MSHGVLGGVTREVWCDIFPGWHAEAGFVYGCVIMVRIQSVQTKILASGGYWMKAMIKKLFTNDLYIKVSKNKLDAKNISTKSKWETICPESPFTTDRLLVGAFSVAGPALKKLVKGILPKSLIPKSPQVVIHPTSQVEGGLSEVEVRIFEELAREAGAFKVALHVGSELTDGEVVKLIGSIKKV